MYLPKAFSSTKFLPLVVLAWLYPLIQCVPSTLLLITTFLLAGHPKTFPIIKILPSPTAFSLYNCFSSIFPPPTTTTVTLFSLRFSSTASFSSSSLYHSSSSSASSTPPPLSFPLLFPELSLFLFHSLRFFSESPENQCPAMFKLRPSCRQAAISFPSSPRFCKTCAIKLACCKRSPSNAPLPRPWLQDKEKMKEIRR